MSTDETIEIGIPVIKPEDPQTPPAPSVITDISEIKALCARPIKVELDYAGKRIAIETRHLTPKEIEVLSLMEDEVVPPFIKGKTESEDRHDYGNVEYRKKRTKLRSRMRSLSLFWATPALRVGVDPKVVDAMYDVASRETIANHVQGMLTEDLQVAIFAVINSVEVSVPELVNFT